MKHNQIFVFLLVCISLLFVGCGSAPIKDPDQAERLVAAKYALAKDYTLAKLVERCQGLAVNTRRHAEQVQRQWQDNNWPLVDAANKEFQVHLKDSQLKHGSEAGQLPFLRYLMELDNQAREDLYRFMRHEAYRDDRCVRALDKFLLSQWQLSADKRQYAYLQFLRKYYGKKIASPHSVPDIETEYLAQRDVGGESLYQAENMAEKSLCDDFEILNLLQQGPREVYGIFCNDEENHLIKCEWGNCRIFQE